MYKCEHDKIEAGYCLDCGADLDGYQDWVVDVITSPGRCFNLGQEVIARKRRSMFRLLTQ